MLAGDKVIGGEQDDVFRLLPRNISAAQESSVKAIKLKALEFLQVIEKHSHPADKRCLALAKTHLETTVLWLEKGLT